MDLQARLRYIFERINRKKEQMLEGYFMPEFSSAIKSNLKKYLTEIGVEQCLRDLNW